MSGSSSKRLRTYSPSETENWLRCPVLRALDKQWKPVGNHPEPAILGTALAAGLATHYDLIRQDLDPGDLGLKSALESLEQQWIGDGEYTLDGCSSLLTKAMKKGVTTDLLQDGTVVAVEKWIGQGYGSIRPDLILRYPAGLVIWDHKFTMEMQPAWLPRRKAEYDTKFQFWDYASRVGKTYGERVILVGAHLVTPSPKAMAWRIEVPITPDRLAVFEADATRAWDEMWREDSGEVTPMGRWTACNNRDENFGRCKFYDACHSLGRRESAMTTLFIRKEKR